MIQKAVTTKIAKVLIPLIVGISSITVPAASAFFTSPDGGPIAVATPCISSMGPGFWAIKANSPVPVVYLYPSWTMRKNYLLPSIGVTTLGLVGTMIDCTTLSVPPVTLIGRLSTMYGTAFGF